LSVSADRRACIRQEKIPLDVTTRRNLPERHPDDLRLPPPAGPPRGRFDSGLGASVPRRKSDTAHPPLAPRPTEYSADIAAAICVDLAEGRSLREICAAPDMPSPGTVRGWAAADAGGFAAQYARAREALAEHLADEILEIADDAANDWMARKGRGAADGSDDAIANREHITRSRLRVDARKWLLARMSPKNTAPAAHQRPRQSGDRPDRRARARQGDRGGARPGGDRRGR
jgi:hypothetical protein